MIIYVVVMKIATRILYTYRLYTHINFGYICCFYYLFFLLLKIITGSAQPKGGEYEDKGYIYALKKLDAGWGITLGMGEG